MDSTPLFKSIYIDLDALLDTRLSLLYGLSESITLKVIENGNYITRFRDQFDIIAYDIFKALYDNRDKRLLSHALPTPIIGLLRKEYGDIMTNLADKDSEQNHYIYLNVYPYKLNYEEQALLAEGIEFNIPKAKVKIVSMDNEELTPKWVKENIHTMYKYNALEWIEYNTANTKLIYTPLLDVLLIAPALVDGNVENNKINKEIFLLTCDLAKTVIDLTLIDASHFSALLKK